MIKDVVFKATTAVLEVKDLPNQMQGAQVSLASALAWCIREMRLNKVDGTDGSKLKFNLKLDGRPFWGKRLTVQNHENVNARFCLCAYASLIFDTRDL